jgi:hypothetical protein
MRKLSAAVVATAAAMLAVVAPTAASGAGGVHFSSIHYNSFCNTGCTNADNNKEYVTIKNGGTHAVRMRGWKLIDMRSAANGGNNVFRFPRFRLRPGDSVNVHSGFGSRDRHNLYWGLPSPTWNDTGSDTAYLRNRAGLLVDTCTYDSTVDPSPASC